MGLYGPGPFVSNIQDAGCSRRPVDDAFDERYAHRGSHSEASTASSVRFGFCLDDVRTGARIAVEGSNPVVVERIGSQTGHISTSHVAHVQIVINRYVSDKSIARRDV